MDSYYLDGLIDGLKGELNSIRGADKKDWNSIWSSIKEIGIFFKEIYYPTREDKDEAWEKFQNIVQDVKKTQTEDRQKSTEFKDETVLKANNALNTNTMLTYAIVNFLNSFTNSDSENARANLDDASTEMKQAWSYFNKVKGSMLGHDKKEAWEALNDAQNELNNRWDEFHEAGKVAYEERQTVRANKKERIEDNLQKNRERLEKQQDYKTRIERNISNNQDRLYSATSDNYRERVEGWLDEDEANLRNADEAISRIQGWINEDESKLANSH